MAAICGSASAMATSDSLAIVAIELSGTPLWGSDLTFAVTVENAGVGQSEPASLTLLEDIAPFTPLFLPAIIAAEPVPPISELQQRVVSVTWVNPTPGPHRFMLAVHSDADTSDTSDPAWLTIRHSQPLVIITEYLANPSDGPGEWVEISNQADFPVNMVSTRLGDSRDSRALPGLVGKIEPGAYWVLVQDEFAFREFYPGFGGFVIEIPGWQQLNNDGDQIRLIGAGGEIIDSLSFIKLYTDNRSVERIGLAPTFAEPKEWTGSIDPSGATPGRANSVNRELAGKFHVSVSPNPFYLSRADVAQIEYRLEIGERLTLQIFNRSGQLVKTIADETPSATGTMTWDGTDDDGGPVRPGPYVLLGRSDPRGDVVKEVIVVGP